MNTKENKNGYSEESNSVSEAIDTPRIRVSFFENYYEQKPLKTVNLLKWAMTDLYKEEVIMYRTTPDERLRRHIKANLPCVTASGIFEQRNSKGLIQHNGVICIDIDQKDNAVFGREWFAKKQLLAKSFDSLLYAGMSISGNGLYLLFRIAYPEQHKEQFEALVIEIQLKTGLVADRSCSDVCRLRGASYDAYPYCNPRAKPYRGVHRNKTTRVKIRMAREQLLLDQKVHKLISIIRKSHLDITDDYHDWYKIGCALAHEYGKEEGHRLFHLVSMWSPKYYPTECDRQFALCLRNREIGIGTFLHICKKHGLTFK